MDVKENLLTQNSCREENKIMFIKEELTDDSDYLNSLCVKEEVVSIYDEEEGFVLNSSFENQEIKTETGVFAVCDTEATTSLGHLVQDGEQSVSNGLHIKKKGRKNSKLKAKGQVNFAQKVNEFMTESGRISRDVIFKNKIYFCSLCKKCFVGRKSFKQHFKHHFTTGQNRYDCLICSHTSRSVSHMNCHILETHFLQYYEDEKLFTCSLCGKKFNYKKDLKRHIFCHTGEGALKCGECHYSCPRKYQLETHISAAHGYLRPLEYPVMQESDGSLFICHYCRYSCKEKASLRAHIKRHIGYKTHKCPDCNYTCTAGGDLQKHSTIHSDERPFVCNGCKKTFKRRSHLLIHFNGKYGCEGEKRTKNNSKSVKI